MDNQVKIHKEVDKSQQEPLDNSLITHNYCICIFRKKTLHDL